MLLSAGGMLLVGVAFAAFLYFRSSKTASRGPAEWLALGLSMMLVVSCSLFLIMGFTYGPRYADEVAFPVQMGALGEEAPDFTFFRQADQEPMQLSALEGKVVVLNFWATWCAPCLAELPDLNKLQETYGEDGVVVLTVSDESREELIAFEAMLPLQTLAAYLPNPQSLAPPFSEMLLGRPESYVIDRDGVIRDFAAGARDYAYFEENIKPYL